MRRRGEPSFPDPAPTTCVVVDDHPPLREAVAAALAAAGVEVVALAGTEVDALAAVIAHRPSVLVLDLVLPGESAARIVRRVAAMSPETGVVVYTGSTEGEELVETLRAGARGFVRKDAPIDELLRAVTAVTGGESWIDRRLMDTLLRVSAEPPPPELSEREREVLLFLASGQSNTRIGAALHISPDTVRTYIQRAMRKLEAATRTQAVATALRLGLIE